MAGVALSSRTVAVTPGAVATCTVTIRNTSAIVESYAVSVLGDAAGWATPMPATLSLFPGADGTVTIQFQPPRGSSIRAGALDFAVRVAATQNPDDSTVEEGSITVEPFVDITARITPRTSETKRVARHVVSVENRGNAPVTVGISAIDPDEALAFEPSPESLTIDPGESEASSIKVVARKGFARGPAQHRPFQAFVTPPSTSGQPRVQLDATLVQKAGLPKFVPVLIGAAVILVAAAVLVPALTKDKAGGGLFSLTGASNGATTTIAGDEAAGEEGDEAGGAEADVESSDATGGGDDAGGSGGDSGPTSASGGGTASGGGGTTATTRASTTDDGGGTTGTTARPVATTAPPSGSATTTTAPGAAPAPSSTTTTTPPPSTTTTNPNAYQAFLGTWTGSAGCVVISDTGSMSVSGTINGLSMTGIGSKSDANTNNDFTASARRSFGAEDYYQLGKGMLFVTVNSHLKGSTSVALTKPAFPPRCT